MTYRELYESAINKLEKSEITLGEFEKMIEPFNAEVTTDIHIGDKDTISRKAAITQLSHNKNKGDDEWELAVENDIRTIWKLPSTQPERKECEEREQGKCPWYAG